MKLNQVKYLRSQLNHLCLNRQLVARQCQNHQHQDHAPVVLVLVDRVQEIIHSYLHHAHRVQVIIHSHQQLIVVKAVCLVHLVHHDQRVLVVLVQVVHVQPEVLVVDQVIVVLVLPLVIVVLVQVVLVVRVLPEVLVVDKVIVQDSAHQQHQRDQVEDQVVQVLLVVAVTQQVLSVKVAASHQRTANQNVQNVKSSTT